MLDIKDLTETKLTDLNVLLGESTQRFQSSLAALTIKLDEGLAADDRASLMTGSGTIVTTELSQCVEGLKEVAASIVQGNSELLQHVRHGFRFQGTDGSIAEITKAMDSLARMTDDSGERCSDHSQAAAAVRGAGGSGVEERDRQETLKEMQRLLESLRVTGAANQQALRQTIVSRDLRPLVDPPPADHRSIVAVHASIDHTIVHTDDTSQQQALPTHPGPPLSLTATVRPRCRDTCKCQCHEVTTKRTPDGLKTILGKIIFSYNSMPIWNARPCNHPRCLKNSQASVHLNYLFPSWLPRLAFAFSVSWNSLIGSGASLYVNMPRVVSEHSEIFKAIDTNNVLRLQWLFSSKQFLPTDMNEDGVCLLTVSLNLGTSLVQEIFQYHVESLHGETNSGSKQYALYMVKSWPTAKLLLDLHPRVEHRDNHGK